MPTGAPAQRYAPLDDTSSSQKAALTSWWKTFSKKNPKKEEEEAKAETQQIFGVPLQVSIRYANVAISLFDENGRSFIYGYVPIVVAKCGVFLKEKATEIEGIFRLAGAERRIKDLVTIFNTPDKYGKGLDWTGYSVHDASNVLRRYLNQLPEPIIPLEFYDRFRSPLEAYSAQASTATEAQLEDFDLDGAIRTYQQLITELPPLNRQLLLYLLDLMAVFASKSAVNRMTSSNLSSIFQPGILSHPTHDMVPEAYRLSQDVLIFLIEHQDSFLIGMQGTAVDEKTIQEVQSGSPSPAKPPSGTTTPKNHAQQLLGRSASVASTSASARRFDSIRRNVSVSSRGSRQSGLVPSPGPGTPPAGGATPRQSSGLYRSNTVPSQRSGSPAFPSDAFSRETSNGETATIRRIATPTVVSPVSSVPATPAAATEEFKPAITFATGTAPSPQHKGPFLAPEMAAERSPSRSRQTSAAGSAQSLQIEMPPPINPSGNRSGRNSPATTPGKERSLSSLFKQSPFGEADKPDGRKPNKLQKKRPPQNIVSPQSSTASLSATSLPPSPAFPTFPHSRRSSRAPAEGHSLLGVFGRSQDNLAVRPKMPEDYPSTDQTITQASTTHASDQGHNDTLHSPNGSVDTNHGYSSFETADEEALEPSPEKKEKVKRRWRLSSPKKDQKTGILATEAAGSTPGPGPSTSQPYIQNHHKGRSTSTVGSTGPSGMSTTDSSSSATKLNTNDDDERAGRLDFTPSTMTSQSNMSQSNLSTSGGRSFGGWLKGKLQGRDRSGSNERARSPRARSPMHHPYGSKDNAASRQSLAMGDRVPRSANRSVEILGMGQDIVQQHSSVPQHPAQQGQHQNLGQQTRSRATSQQEMQPPVQSQSQHPSVAYVSALQQQQVLASTPVQPQQPQQVQAPTQIQSQQPSLAHLSPQLHQQLQASMQMQSQQAQHSQEGQLEQQPTSQQPPR